MTTNATSLRDAIYTRAVGVSTFKTVRKVMLPTLSGADLPALSVFRLSEMMTPNGDEDAGPPRFISEPVIGISIVRAFDDPLVIDGSLDDDADAILDALYCDTTFVSPPADSPFFFNGTTRISRRTNVIQEGETYAIELRLELTFIVKEVRYDPVEPYWFEEIVTTSFPGTVTEAGIVEAFNVSQTVYTVTGPFGGAHGTPSAPFTVALEAGASFTGELQSITISDGDAGGTITPSVGSPGVGSVTVSPANNATSFTFTYTPTMPGAVSLTFTNGQDWPNPTALVFTAT